MQEQYTAIQQQFNKIISYTQGIANPKTDELFQKWQKAKEEFITAFNGELIYTYPETVTFSLGSKEQAFRFDEFCASIRARWTNDNLADFLEWCGVDAFYNNIVPRNYPYKGITIHHGMKLLKAFKFFEEDKTILTDCQNAASRYIQENKVCGKLCLSVHPLDFLSASENNYNWRSCHALDGDYRAGNLSYMVDNSTIMCYLRSETDEPLHSWPYDVPWNSKKWRVLLFFSNDWEMIFAGRQYPFHSETALPYVSTQILPQIFHCKFSNWYQQKVTDVTLDNMSFPLIYKYIPVGGKLKTINKLVYNGDGALQFNDLLNSSCYDPMWCYQLSNSWFKLPHGLTSSKTKFIVGQAVKCLDCENNNIEHAATMRCPACEANYGDLENDDFGYCSCCGRHILLEDGIWLNDEILCQSCVESECSCCESCGELVYNDDLIYDRETNQYICINCNNDRRI